MFLKSIASFILAHTLMLGTSNTQVYVAPVQKITPKTSIATSTHKTTVTTLVAKNGKPVVKKVSEKIPIKPTKTQAIKKEVAPELLPDFEAINTFARKAIVNILCTTKNGALSPISGTGVVISPNGVVLTNAHVGQLFLQVVIDLRQEFSFLVSLHSI